MDSLNSIHERQWSEMAGDITSFNVGRSQFCKELRENIFSYVCDAGAETRPVPHAVQVLALTYNLSLGQIYCRHPGVPMALPFGKIHILSRKAWSWEG